uniref:Small integral membrane protein 22 n=1 Tax=Naja naja TaxID=35670 RepID=A0A8C6XC61_NAJNA
MGTPGRDVAEDISQQINDVLGRLESKQLFQTTWDIVAFAIFFTFIGMVLLLGFLALIRCCCCDCDTPSSYKKVSSFNKVMAWSCTFNDGTRFRPPVWEDGLSVCLSVCLSPSQNRKSPFNVYVQAEIGSLVHRRCWN